MSDRIRFLLVGSMLALGSCAHRTVAVSQRIAGGEEIRLYRLGKTFKQAENNRVVVTDCGLQTIRQARKLFVRWTFSIRPKQPTELRSIRVEDVMGSGPVLLVDDVAPKQDAGKWTRNSRLIELTLTAIPWLFEPVETTVVIRFTITEMDGRHYVLFQGVNFTPEAKSAIRHQVRQ